MKPEITQELLKRLLNYNPETGVFTWKERPVSMFSEYRYHKSWNSRHKGAVAGCVSKIHGYRVIRIEYVLLRAHRLAWMYMKGCWPENEIDHIDGDRSNNKSDNLRTVDHAENHKNQGLNINNTSGHTGVRWNKNLDKWQSIIKHRYQQIHLGVFTDLNDAIRVRKAAEVEYGFHPNHGNRESHR